MEEKNAKLAKRTRSKKWPSRPIRPPEWKKKEENGAKNAGQKQDPFETQMRGSSSPEAAASDSRNIAFSQRVTTPNDEEDWRRRTRRKPVLATNMSSLNRFSSTVVLLVTLWFGLANGLKNEFREYRCFVVIFACVILGVALNETSRGH